MVSDGKHKDILITRTFDAPVEKVWKAWTEPEQVKRWWGPEHFTCPAATIDLRVGGKAMMCMHGPAGSPFDMDMWSCGIYKEIIPMKKIVSTDNFCDKNGNIIPASQMGMPGDWSKEMLVTVTFEDLGNGKTKLTLKHEGHPVEISKDAEAGWTSQLDKLAALLK